MILSPSKRFVFIHIHRTGGSSLERAIEPHLSWDDTILGSSDFGEAVAPAFAQRFGLHKHSSISDIERICGERYLDRYWCFALVRHPIERICSLYNFTASLVLKWAEARGLSRTALKRAVASPDAADYEPLRWPTSRAFMQSDSFGEYVRSDEIMLEEGFRPQVSRLRSARSGGVRAKALRLEDQAVWLPTLSSRLGMQLEWTHSHQSERSLVSAASLRPEDVSYLEDLFEQDLRLFSY